MNNYKVITDESVLKQFIDWLPDLKSDETFYCCLFARSKYVKDSTHLPHIRSDKAQLKRFTSNKERLLLKIRQLECPVGAYMQKDIVVPQEALALYITINPRSFTKANTASVRKLLDLALQPYNGFHPYQEVMSEIQKAKSRSEFVSFDFDCHPDDFVYAKCEIDRVVNQEALSIVQTRGGFHVIVRPSLVLSDLSKNWYHSMREILNKYSDDHDNAGDIMLPVPGTYQGGFTPTFI
ncbi:Uncharacterised protein [Sphingobacterium multivorum]|uniref:hypothetical protein n=1 Tax=Sphingobacterium multivorum TaxID=28454 RepID=UPI000E022E17|nr:hypothetical protein [Sphingobacterium multivorum]QQT43364.1 hypothetical protein I6J00_16595 [Sphingobacterium multivorum]SUI98453.1 Uncharacterised protein [Sphingobacterium multivorum]